MLAIIALAFLILDPLSDLSQQVRRWPELSGMTGWFLVDPTQDGNLTVGLNPFASEGITSEEERKELASEWMHIIGEITGDTSGNMRRVVNIIVSVCCLATTNQPHSMIYIYF